MTTTKSLLKGGYEKAPDSWYKLPNPVLREGAQLVDLEWWEPEAGCDSLQYVVDNSRRLLENREVLLKSAEEVDDTISEFLDEVWKLEDDRFEGSYSYQQTKQKLLNAQLALRKLYQNKT